MLNPHGLEYRTLQMKGLGMFRVPQHITGTMFKEKYWYWKVRLSKQNLQKYFCFSNASEAGDRLREAINWLNKMYLPLPDAVSEVEGRNKQDKIGTRGVRFQRMIRKGRKVEEYSFVVDQSLIGKLPLLVYVGTQNTITRQKYYDKLREARTERRNIVQKVKALRKAKTLRDYAERVCRA